MAEGLSNESKSILNRDQVVSIGDDLDIPEWAIDKAIKMYQENKVKKTKWYKKIFEWFD